jgi:hypothetical protein
MHSIEILKRRTSRLLLATLTVTSCGCAGYEKLLFVTKTNVGIDIDSTPPTAELTIARREGVIQPTFADTKDGEANTPAVLASFGLDGVWNPDIYGLFAGGDAAVVIVSSDAPPGEGDDASSSICMNSEPEGNVIYDFIVRAIGSGDSTKEPFYFGTDTSFGLKVAWSGMTSAIPDTVKLGYNRKEFALAPIHVRPNKDETVKRRGGNGAVVRGDDPQQGHDDGQVERTEEQSQASIRDRRGSNEVRGATEKGASRTPDADHRR